MFRDFKRGGYNLEITRVSVRRLVSLVLLICLSYSLSTFVGQNIKSKGIAKYVHKEEITRYVYFPQRFLIDRGWDRDDERQANEDKEFVVLQIVAAIDSAKSDSDRRL